MRGQSGRNAMRRAVEPLPLSMPVAIGALAAARLSRAVDAASRSTLGWPRRPEGSEVAERLQRLDGLGVRLRRADGLGHA